MLCILLANKKTPTPEIAYTFSAIPTMIHRNTVILQKLLTNILSIRNINIAVVVFIAENNTD